MLKEFLVKLLESGALGAFAYPFIEWMKAEWPWFAAAKPWIVRLTAWVASAVLGSLPFLAMVAMAYEPNPGDWRKWVEKLFAVCFVAVTASQTWHIAKAKG